MIFAKKESRATTEVDSATMLNTTNEFNTNEKMCQLDIDILELLKEGKQTRADLVSKLHVYDYTIRDHIRSLRLMGYPICSYSHSKGYWLGDREDIEKTIAEHRSRVEAEFELIAALVKCLKNTEQVEMELK